MTFPTPQVDPFTTSKTRRAFIKYSIKDERWRTESGASIMRSLQAGGVGIRKEDFLAVRREKLESFERREQFKTVDRDDLIPYGYMNETHGVKLTNTAQYRLIMTVRDPKTRELSYVPRSIGADEHFDRGYIEDFASSLFSMGGEDYEFDIVEIVLDDVWLTPGGNLT